MNINTFSTYYPDNLDDVNLVSYHENLRLWVKANASEDIDTKPGSVIGDLILGTESIINASLDKALSNFTSDLDLANPASGVIYNCDFVGKYVENFSTTGYTDITSSGAIRLVFSDPSFRVIDRGTQFRAGTQIFLPRVYKEGNLRILSPGQTKSHDYNDYLLAGIDDRFYVDIYVYSMEPTAVQNLETFEISELIPGLVEIYAIGDFWSRESTTSIQALANKTRITAVSANTTTRSGLVRLVRQEFPDVKAVSPVLLGDFELTRQSYNALGLPAPVVDLYIKTPLYGTEMKETFRVNFDSSTDCYFGEITLNDTPIRFNNVSFTDELDISLGFSSYFYSTDPKLPGLNAYGTSSYRIWVKIPNLRDSAGQSIVPPLVDVETNQFYQTFEVSYLCDPGIKIIEDFFTAPDTKPIGIDLRVKLFRPIAFTALYINYSRKRGVKLNQAKAREEINAYLQTISWPESYSDATIIDSMFYAGASNVFKIESDAKLLVGPCDFLILTIPEELLPVGELTVDFINDSDNVTQIPKFTITGSNNFSYTAKDTNPNFEDNLHYSTGPRNISFLINNDQILFREVGNNVV